MARVQNDISNATRWCPALGCPVVFRRISPRLSVVQPATHRTLDSALRTDNPAVQPQRLDQAPPSSAIPPSTIHCRFDGPIRLRQVVRRQVRETFAQTRRLRSSLHVSAHGSPTHRAAPVALPRSL